MLMGYDCRWNAVWNNWDILASGLGFTLLYTVTTIDRKSVV